MKKNQKKKFLSIWRSWPFTVSFFIMFIYLLNIEVFIILYFIIMCFFFYAKNDYFFLCFILFFLFIFLFFIKNLIIKKSINNYNQHFIYLNIFFLFFNLANIVFNFLRFIFQDYYIWIKQYFFSSENGTITIIIDNLIPIIAWQTCYALLFFCLIIYCKYYLYDIYIEKMLNKYIDIKKDVMKYPDDYKSSYIYKYKNIYKISFILWRVIIFIVGINAYFKLYKFFLYMNIFLAFLLILSFFIELIFNLNNYYIVYKYFKKKKNEENTTINSTK